MAGGELIDAVGRIESTLTGTGFVVDKANRLILTCRHVVAGKRTATFMLPHLDLSIDCDVEEAPAGKQDWALLTAKAPLPDQVSELKLHRFRWNGCVIPFTSYGFATLYAAAGAGYLSGEVRGLIAGIDLRADELAGKRHQDVEGLSGAPCLINGVAVGLVWATLTGAAGSTLRAIPADVLHDESNQRIPVADAVMLPYEDVFLSRLDSVQRPTLELAGDQIGVDDKLGDDATYRRRLARAMLAGGLTATVNALVEMRSIVSEQVVKELAILAESLWIDAVAAQTASALASSPLPRGVLWNATDEATLIDLLRRACWHHRKGRPLWHVKAACLIVHNPTGESHGRGLVEEIAMHFERDLNKKTPAEIRERLANVNVGPVIAVIFEAVPSAAVLAELAQNYPGLRVLFTDPKRRASVPDVTMILPEVPAQREASARAARKDARDNLEIYLDLVIGEKDFRL